MMEEPINELRIKLDREQIDSEELLYSLVTLVESLDDAMDGNTVVEVSMLKMILEDNLAEYLAGSERCARETYRATLETPAEFCENEAEPDSDYCLEHR